MHEKRESRSPVLRLLKSGWLLLSGLSASDDRRGSKSPDRAPSDHVDPSDSGSRYAISAPRAPGDALALTTAGAAASTDGLASVRNGQVEITNPSRGGLLAVLVPSDDLVLSIDGLQVTTPISVWAGQNITVTPRATGQPLRQYSVEVDPDNMGAWLNLAAQGSPGYRVVDTGPAHVLRLQACAMPGSQRNPSPEEIEEALATAGVVAGVDRAAVLMALEEKGATRVQVARGRPVVASRSGRVEPLMPAPRGGVPADLGVRVLPGQPLARLIPPEPGERGYDLTGRNLEPGPVRSPRLVAGEGAQLTPEGTEVLAGIPGRPIMFEVEPDLLHVAVVPVTEISGHLTYSPIPYQFIGDVMIEGDVGEGSHVQASGWIWVKGSVQGSVLQAGQGIRVDRTVQHSHLITRSGRRVLTPMLHEYSRMLADLEQMSDYGHQIIGHPRYAELSRSKSFGEVMLLLAQNRFRDLRHGISQVRKLLPDLTIEHLRLHLEAALNMLEQRVYSGGMSDIHDVAQLIAGFAAAVQHVRQALGSGSAEGPVHVHTLLWSQVDADGQVVVYGSGAELATVRALGSVQIPKLRNSNVMSAQAIEIGTVVTSEADKTVLEVSVGGEIRIDLAVTPVTLRVGEWQYRLQPDSRGTYVQSDRDGRIRITERGRQAAAVPDLASGVNHLLQKR